VIIPTPSNDLLSGLREGRGDIAAGNLTITPERKKIVDFSDPFASGAKEIIVAGVRGLRSSTRWRTFRVRKLLSVPRAATTRA